MMRYRKSGIVYRLAVLLCLTAVVFLDAGRVYGSVKNPLQSIYGTYQSRIWSGRSFKKASTEFFIDPGGRISGTYVFLEQSGAVRGELYDCVENRSNLKMRCRWRDRYGEGVLQMYFSHNYDSFEGYWRFGNNSAYLPWNGER